jgi:probable H4MPT-linked C1 transfer pathway protein
VLATFAGRFTEQAPAMLIDVGSTTSDIVPLIDGKPVTDSQSDTQRLLRGELVYIGVERTPIATLVDEVPYHEGTYPIARELFATTRDVYTLLGRFPEAAIVQDTADGKPSTKVAARVRLGRMICADEGEFNHRDATVMAEALAESFVEELARRIQQVQSLHSHQPTVCVVSGHGEFVAQAALDRIEFTGRRVSLKQEIDELCSRCAPAHALAVLAREEIGQ